LLEEHISEPGLVVGISELIEKLDESEIVVVLPFEENGRAIAKSLAKLPHRQVQEWFEMPEIRRRSLAQAVWIPIRVSETTSNGEKREYQGSCEEYFGLSSVMFEI